MDSKSTSSDDRKVGLDDFSPVYVESDTESEAPTSADSQSDEDALAESGVNLSSEERASSLSSEGPSLLYVSDTIGPTEESQNTQARQHSGQDTDAPVLTGSDASRSPGPRDAGMGPTPDNEPLDEPPLPATTLNFQRSLKFAQSAEPDTYPAKETRKNNESGATFETPAFTDSEEQRTSRSNNLSLIGQNRRESDCAFHKVVADLPEDAAFSSASENDYSVTNVSLDGRTENHEDACSDQNNADIETEQGSRLPNQVPQFPSSELPNVTVESNSRDLGYGPVEPYACEPEDTKDTYQDTGSLSSGRPPTGMTPIWGSLNTPEKRHWRHETKRTVPTKRAVPTESEVSSISQTFPPGNGEKEGVLPASIMTRGDNAAASSSQRSHSEETEPADNLNPASKPDVNPAMDEKPSNVHQDHSFRPLGPLVQRFDPLALANGFQDASRLHSSTIEHERSQLQSGLADKPFPVRPGLIVATERPEKSDGHSHRIGNLHSVAPRSQSREFSQRSSSLLSELRRDDSSEEIITSIARQIAELQADNTSMKDSIETYKSIHVKLEEEISQLNQENDFMTGELDLAKSTANKLQDKNDTLQRNLSSSRKETQRLDTEVRHLQLESEQRRASNALDELKAFRAQNQQDRSHEDAKRIELLEEQIEGLQSEKSSVAHSDSEPGNVVRADGPTRTPHRRIRGIQDEIQQGPTSIGSRGGLYIPKRPAFDPTKPGGIPPPAFGKFLYTSFHDRHHELLIKIHLIEAGILVRAREFELARRAALKAGMSAYALRNRALIGRCAFYRALAEHGLQSHQNAVDSYIEAKRIRGRFLEGEQLPDKLRRLCEELIGDNCEILEQRIARDEYGDVLNEEGIFSSLDPEVRWSPRVKGRKSRVFKHEDMTDQWGVENGDEGISVSDVQSSVAESEEDDPSVIIREEDRDSSIPLRMRFKKQRPPGRESSNSKHRSANGKEDHQFSSDLTSESSVMTDGFETDDGLSEFEGSTDEGSEVSLEAPFRSNKPSSLDLSALQRRHGSESPGALTAKRVGNVGDEPNHSFRAPEDEYTSEPESLKYAASEGSGEENVS